MPLSDDIQQAVTANVRAALVEDVGTGDVTALLIDAEVRAQARVITRQSGVFCGEPWVRETCRQISGDIRVDFGVNEGDRISPDQALFWMEGPARSMLTAERTMLNFVQLLSGTATLTRHYLDLIEGTPARLLDTRKTLPGLRVAQKYAVRCGGGHNHRMGLYDAFLIKENHIAAAGGIRGAIERARRLRPELKVEVEVENLTQLQEAVDARADIVMLDNFSLEDTRRAVKMPRHGVKLEASGNIDADTIRQVAETRVDYISLGAITKQVTPLDLSMRLV